MLTTEYVFFSKSLAILSCQRVCTVFEGGVKEDEMQGLALIG